MEIEIKRTFVEKWDKYFSGSELPLACFYSDELHGAEFANKPKENKKGYTCIFSQLAAARAGKPRAFNQDNFGCFGATGTLGFSTKAPTKKEIAEMVDFLINEERFKKSEEHVMAMMQTNPPLSAKGKYLILKRWDTLSMNDTPQIVCFFASPDVIAGLFALANYDTMNPHGVISPFGSGCDALIGFAMKEYESEEPKAVLGGFDPPMRACVKPKILTFSVPYSRLVTMIENMDDCFLNTYIWDGINKRIQKT
jgi:hypothetical protein